MHKPASFLGLMPPILWCPATVSITPVPITFAPSAPVPASAPTPSPTPTPAPRPAPTPAPMPARTAVRHCEFVSCTGV